MAAPTRSRIAPTPSGYLHRGNAFSFLLTEALTQQRQGSLRLRIDDLDAPRVRQEYLRDIFETLRWLGIAPDKGPADEAGHMAHYTQQARIPQYNALLAQLAATGNVFACTCSRTDVLQRSIDGQYAGTCRDKALPLHTKHAAWRFRTDSGASVTWQDGICGTQTVPLYQQVRDFIIRRRDGLPAYHVASLCDDVAYGINLIVRGADLLQSTAAQLYLAEIAGLASFRECRFYHHPLLKNKGGEKLSKSAGSYSLKEARLAGMTAADMRCAAAEWHHSFLPAGC